MIVGVTGLTEDGQGRRGSAGAGKDLVADRLVQKHGFVKVALADEIKRIAMRLWDFSEETLWGDSALRNIPDKRYPIMMPMNDPLGLHHEDKKALVALGARDVPPPVEMRYLTPRHALQQIGTEVARLIDPDVWVRFAMNVAKKLLTPEEIDGDLCWRYYYRTRGLEGYTATRTRGVVVSDVRYPNEISGIRGADGKVWRKKRSVVVLKGGAATHTSETALLDVPDDSFDDVFPDTEIDTLQQLIDRTMDIYTGRIRPYDPEQADIPPFKRR